MSHAFVDEDKLITIAEFDAFLDRQREGALWELVRGRIVAMTNPTEVHEQIVANIGAPLKLAMDRLGCRVYFGGMRVQRSDDRSEFDKYRPDLIVRCGPVSAKNYVTDPVVVVEVLLPSTIEIDRVEKLVFYKGLTTMRHVVFIYQHQMRAEHHRRTEMGWELEPLNGADDGLALDAVQFALPLGTAYFGVALPA